MIQSYEAVIDQHGELKILDPVELPRGRRIIITILEDEINGELTTETLESIPVTTIGSQVENPKFKPSGIIAELLENPIRVDNFKPLTRDEIYDRRQNRP